MSGKNVWCVTPVTRTIHLLYVDREGEEHPFWIKIKERLTVGEQKRAQAAGFGGMRAGGGDDDRVIAMDWQTMSFGRAEMYLTEWSLESDPETHVKLALTRETIESLDPDVFLLMENAITEHVKEMEAAKNLRAGGSRPSAKLAS